MSQQNQNQSRNPLELLQEAFRTIQKMAEHYSRVREKDLGILLANRLASQTDDEAFEALKREVLERHHSIAPSSHAHKSSMRVDSCPRPHSPVGPRKQPVLILEP